MKPWKPGDPVATGVIVFESAEDRAEYGHACAVALKKCAEEGRLSYVDQFAKKVLAEPELYMRRILIRSAPTSHRAEIEARVKELWLERKQRIQNETSSENQR